MSESQQIGEIEVASLSDVGRRRSDNQDACGEFRNDRGEILLVLADGMGGHRGGATASRICVDTVARVFESDASDPPDRLRQAFEIANEEVYFQAQSEAELEGMGATGVALLLRPEEARGWLAWAGDSRAYRLRERTIEALTSDHSLVAEWVRAGVLTPEEARGHPRSHELTRAVGVLAELEPEIAEIDLRGGDRLLLCSDGLCGVVPDTTLESTLAFGDPESGARKLIERANAMGGPDNITVQILAVGHADAPAQICIPERVDVEADASEAEPEIDASAPFEAVFNTDDSAHPADSPSVDEAVLEIAAQALREQEVPELGDSAVEFAGASAEPALGVGPFAPEAPAPNPNRPTPVRIPLRPREPGRSLQWQSLWLGTLVGGAIVALGMLTQRPAPTPAPATADSPHPRPAAPDATRTGEPATAPQPTSTATPRPTPETAHPRAAEPKPAPAAPPAAQQSSPKAAPSPSPETARAPTPETEPTQPPAAAPASPAAPSPPLPPAPELPTLDHLDLPTELRAFLDRWLAATTTRDWPGVRALGFPASYGELDDTWGEREALRVLEVETEAAKTSEKRLYVRVLVSWAFETPAGRFRTEDEQRLILQRTAHGLRWGGHWQ